MSIPSATTETSTTVANPDGSFTKSTFSGPVRVQRNESWTPIDTSLVKDSFGIHPNVAKASYSFANGLPSAGALATITTSSGSFAFRWPTKLAAPSISGDTATYSNIFSGVDMTLVARPTAFEVSFILHQRPSTAPTFSLPVTLPAGTTLKELTGGNLQLVDAQGNTVFLIGGNEMHDAIDPTTGLPHAVQPFTVNVTTTSQGSEIDLSPDMAFLTDPKTVYPVTIDPSGSLPDNLDTRVVNGPLHNQNYDSDPSLYVGYNSIYGTLSRSFLRFDDSVIKNANVSSAKLGLHQTGHATCTAEPTKVEGSAGMGPGTTWDTQPHLDGINWGQITYNGGNGCAPSPFEYIDITGLAQAWSHNGYPAPEALAMLAGNESDGNQFKQFDSAEITSFAPHIDVTYTTSATGTCFNTNHCWGLDTTAAQNATSMNDAKAHYGAYPDFIGRYLGTGGGPTLLSSGEVSLFHSLNVGILLLTSETSTCPSTAAGTQEATDAAALAVQLGMPANGTLTIFQDIEAGNIPLSSCLTAYADTLTSKGFHPGWYENPGDFQTPFCAATSDANVAGALLDTTQPSTGTTTEAASPTFAPTTVNCSGGHTEVWQYGINDTLPTGEQYDTDELAPSYLSSIYHP